MGRQLIQNGATGMAESRKDLASILTDPKDADMLSEVNDLPDLELQVTSAYNDVERVVDGEIDPQYLDQKINVLNSRIDALNLKTADIAEKSNANMISATEDSRNYGNNAVLYTGLAIGISVIISIVISIVTASLITNPIKHLMNVARRISWGDFNATAEVRSKDELGELADSLNRMCKALRTMNEMLNKDSIPPVQSVPDEGFELKLK